MLVRVVGRAIHEGASAVFRPIGGVLYIEMRGDLTGGALRHFANHGSRVFGEVVSGFVLDYRAAAAMPSRAELLALPIGVPARHPLRMPGAFLPRSEAVDLMRGHALNLALQGFSRRTFTDEDQAHVWVTRQSRAA